MTGIVAMLVAGGWPPLSAGMSPGTVSGAGITTTNGGNAVAVTNAALATATGNVGSVTYSWAHVSGDNAVINSPTGQSTTFTRSVATSGLVSRSGVFRCTVTDTATGRTATADVTVNTSHEYDPP